VLSFCFEPAIGDGCVGNPDAIREPADEPDFAAEGDKSRLFFPGGASSEFTGFAPPRRLPWPLIPHLWVRYRPPLRLV
jgi:hypothetical protein